MKKTMLLFVALVIGLTSVFAQDNSRTPEQEKAIAKKDLTFEQEKFQFGTVDQGAKVEHNFSFTNTNANPIMITNVRTTCGCTVPQWPREPIAAGEGADINAVFNTRGKRGYQRKVITINYTIKGANGDEVKTTTVALEGTVQMPTPSEGN